LPEGSSGDYIPEIDFLRGVSIVGVLLIHIVSQPLWREAASGFTIPYALFWNQLSRFCVPIFILISGLLVTYRHDPTDFPFRFLKRRAVNVLVPYSFWTIFSILNLHRWGELNPGWIRKVVLLGQGYYFHLYFIPLIVQFYLLSPLVFLFYRGRRLKVFLGVSLACNVVYLAYFELVFLDFLPGTSWLARWSLENIQPTFFAWVGYFILGCFLGRRLEEFRDWIEESSWWPWSFSFLLGLGFVLGDYYYSVLRTGKLFSPGENFMRPAVFLYSIVAFAFFWKTAVSFRSGYPAAIFRALGNYSFGIYLTHIFFQNVLKRLWGDLFFSNWYGASLACLLVLLLSYGTTWLLSRDEHGWILVGKTVRRKVFPGRAPKR